MLGESDNKTLLSFLDCVCMYTLMKEKDNRWMEKVAHVPIQNSFLCVPPSFSHTKGNRKVLLQLLKRREKKMAFLMEGEHLFIT